MQIKNSVIVVTGGAQGLGRSMAEDFARQGAKLALIDMNADMLADAAAEVPKALGARRRSNLSSECD